MSLFDGRAWDTVTEGVMETVLSGFRQPVEMRAKGPQEMEEKKCWAKRHQKGQENVIREYRKEGVRKVVEGVGVGPVGLDSHFAKSECM